MFSDFVYDSPVTDSDSLLQIHLYSQQYNTVTPSILFESSCTLNQIFSPILCLKFAGHRLHFTVQTRFHVAVVATTPCKNIEIIIIIVIIKKYIA